MRGGNAMKYRFLSMGILCLSFVTSVQAATCSVSAQNMNFGVYDLVSALDSSATLTVVCSRTKPGNEKVSYTLSLSVGAGSFAMRELRYASSVMYYNLYQDAARTSVWGDGSQVFSDNLNIPPGSLSSSRQHTVYGRIPGNQTELEVGTYSSPAPIVVTITYD